MPGLGFGCRSRRLGRAPLAKGRLGPGDVSVAIAPPQQTREVRVRVTLSRPDSVGLGVVIAGRTCKRLGTCQVAPRFCQARHA